jgi:hypothetical protein
LNYDNWHLTFIDDSGDDTFKETFLNYGFNRDKIEYIPILMSDSEKVKIGGSMFGKYVNESIINSDCDIVMLICDDDALDSNYLNNLNDFYTNNPNEMWSYSHVIFYNPEIESYINATNKIGNLNRFTTPINPRNNVDSSQVTFRKLALVNGGIWYAYPKTVALDADIFTKMYNKYGNCKFNGYTGQYKGWFDNQLGSRIRRGKGNYL